MQLLKEVAAQLDFFVLFKITKVSISLVYHNLGCNFEIRGNNFINNSAMNAGGAIFYNLYSPNGLRENIFVNNTAFYGPSIGSYPFKIDFIN
jgi:hypothetical protein